MNYQLFQVGGHVRDELLGIPSKDIDYSVVLEDITQPIEKAFFEFEETLKDQGYEVFLSTPDCFTIRAKFPKDHIYSGVADFVLARRELYYQKNTRTPVSVLGSIEDDLIRRDFTINTLAKDEDGDIIDLFDGRVDLHNSVLRTPLDAAISINQDPLRILRAFRFATTKQMVFSDELVDAIKGFYFLKMGVVSKERIREELQKMFLYNSREALRQLDLLKEMNNSLYYWILNKVTFTVNVNYDENNNQEGI